MSTRRKRKDEIFELFRPYFGKALALLRGKRSQEALAKSAGMDPGTLRRLEKGEAPLRQDYISGLCQALEITFSDLLRKVADCWDEAEKESGFSYHQMSSQEILDRLRRIHDARARLEREATEIDLEIKRRQISNGQESRDQPQGKLGKAMNRLKR